MPKNRGMIFIPIGLQAKIKDPPYFVAAITVITAFVSILAFKGLNDFYKQFSFSESQQKYFYQLRSLYIDSCDAFQNQKICSALIQFKNSDIVRNPYMANSDAFRYVGHLNDLDKSIYTDWHSADTIKKELKKKNRTHELQKLEVITAGNNKSVAQLYKRYRLFSKHSFNIISLIKAQLTHGDWFHLIGNLVFFVFFGSCLEQSMGKKWLASIYILGGTLGLTVQLMASTQSQYFILGASANIFACAGAFLRLYWRQPLQILFSFFFVVNRTIKMPTWSFFVFFILMQQIVGLVDKNNNGIAYLAHIVGFIIGYALAHIWALTKDSTKDVFQVFPYEHKMLLHVEHIKSCKEKLNTLIDLLYYAPFNIAAYEKIQHVHNECVCPEKCISDGSKKFIANQFAELLKKIIYNKQSELAAELYTDMISIGCSPELLLKNLTIDDVLFFGNYFYKIQEIEKVEQLFKVAMGLFSENQRHVFIEFLDSIRREKGGQYAS